MATNKFYSLNTEYLLNGYLMGNETNINAISATLTMSVTMSPQIFDSVPLDLLNMDREIKSITDKYQVIVLST